MSAGVGYESAILIYRIKEHAVMFHCIEKNGSSVSVVDNENDTEIIIPTFSSTTPKV